MPTATTTRTARHGDDRLDETFHALSNSTRRAILARLAVGEANVNELAEPFEMTLPAISKHLKVLERAGLITRGRRAQYRPCALNPEPLAAVADWTERYRSVWEERFDRLDDYLARLPPAPRTSTPRASTPQAETGIHDD